MPIVASLAASACMMLAAILFMSCSQTAIKKDEVVLAKILADGKTVVVTGCKDAPIVESDLNTVLPLVPLPSGVNSAVVVTESTINLLCTKIQAVNAAVGGK